MDSDYGWIFLIGAIIAIIYIVNKISTEIVGEKKNILKIKKEIEILKQEQTRKEQELDKKITYIDQKDKEINQIINEKSQEFPYLANILAEWQYMHDTLIVHMLENKKRPAHKAADEIRIISREKRVIDKKCRAFEHQIKMYEELFPWLEEFKELPPEEAYRYVSQQEEQDEYDRIKDWLSPEEYSNLSDSQKWQLALDRYTTKNNKTNWHIGIEYERYIGYLYESKGYKVYYEGALMGLEDKGRDLIVERETDCLIIQCKRWAKEKEIHEKHIMQLFGSVAELSLKNNKDYKGVLITTTSLSKMAKHFAELLNIEVVEKYEYKTYPLIKCNISSSGEKIFHLPFDQQYDRIHIDINKGNMYVKTVSEAEQRGFRHAYRWKGTQTNI